MKKFPSKKGLNIRIAVYVPSTQGLTRRIPAINHKRRAKEVADAMRSLFGGTTSVNAKGSWSSNGTVAREDIILVESFTKTADWKKNANKLRLFLLKKKKEWEQESISYEWEDVSKDIPYEGMNFL